MHNNSGKESNESPHIQQSIVKMNMGRYDVFGLIAPGLIIALSGIASLIYGHNKGMLWLYEGVGGAPNNTLLLFVALLLLSAYVIGHINDGLSLLFVEKILLRKLHDYPYVRILSLPVKYGKDSSRTKYYRATFLLIYLFPLLLIVSEIYFTKHSALLYIDLGLLVTIVGLKIVSSAKQMPHRRRVTLHKLAFHQLSPFSWMSLLFGALENVFRKLLELNKMLPERVANRYWEKLTEITGIKEVKSLGTDIYWITYMHVASARVDLRDAINKQINTSTFSRNMSFSLLISTMIVAVSIKGERPFDPAEVHLIIISLVLYLAGIMMLLRYYYWYEFYTRFLIRQFVYVV